MGPTLSSGFRNFPVGYVFLREVCKPFYSNHKKLCPPCHSIAIEALRTSSTGIALGKTDIYKEFDCVERHRLPVTGVLFRYLGSNTTRMTVSRSCSGRLVLTVEATRRCIDCGEFKTARLCNWHSEKGVRRSVLRCTGEVCDDCHEIRMCKIDEVNMSIFEKKTMLHLSK